MSDIGGLQLLPSQQRKTSVSMSGGNGALAIAGLCFLALGIAYGVASYLISATQKDITSLEAQIGGLYDGRDRAMEQELVTLQKQLAMTEKLLGAHVRWSSMIMSITRSILPNVRLVSFTTNATQRTYSFSAVADSYTTVARQIAALYATEAVREVSVGKVTRGTAGNIEFSVDLTLKL